MRTIGAVLLAFTLFGCGATTTPPSAIVAATAAAPPDPTPVATSSPPASPGPSSSPSPRPCVPTVANGMTPPGEEPGTEVYGDDGLFVGVWPKGEILADPRFVGVDGSVDMKFWMWRARGVGKAGDLSITGHELTTGAAIVAKIPDGYGQRFQATGITFPTDGCYEVTVRSGVAELRFVTKVTKVAAPPG